MHIIRYRSGGSQTARVGVLIGDRVRELADVDALTALWALRLDDLKELLCSFDGDGELALSEVVLLPPIDGRTEVWACGVTYEISQQARIEESEQSADVYQRVYNAQRPELFYKSAAWRVVGDGQAIAIRSDSTLDVPEPEVALVVNAFGEIAGYTGCDDVSSRSARSPHRLSAASTRSRPPSPSRRRWGEATARPPAPPD